MCGRYSSAINYVIIKWFQPGVKICVSSDLYKHLPTVSVLCAGLIVYTFVSVLLHMNLPPRCWPCSGWTWSLECASGYTPPRHLLNVCSQTLRNRWTHTQPGSSLHRRSARCLARFGLERRKERIRGNGRVLMQMKVFFLWKTQWDLSLFSLTFQSKVS